MGAVKLQKRTSLNPTSDPIHFLFPDPELLDLQLNDSNAVLRVLREMVDVRLLVNPRFLLIWNAFLCYTNRCKDITVEVA